MPEGPAPIPLPPKRLFVALPLAEPVRNALSDLAVLKRGFRWVRTDNIHLTLRFIGDCDADTQARFSEALSRIRVHRFLLPISSLGVFPAKGRPKVLWAGLGAAHPCLFQLRQRVDDALLSVAPWLDVHTFQPHITIARLDDSHNPRALAEFLKSHRDFEGPPFMAEEFVLYSSQQNPGQAPSYSIERRFPLEHATT